MTRPMNRAILQLARRAETAQPSSLVATFVNAGPLFDLLHSRDAQILFGRRGTGKTHALTYLVETIKDERNHAISIDMRSIGSTGSVYNDPSATLPERGTRLLLDVLNAIEDDLVEYTFEHVADGSESHALTYLDRLADELSKTRIVGSLETESAEGSKHTDSSRTSLGVGLAQSPSLQVATTQEGSDTVHSDSRTRRAGIEQYRVHIGAIGHWLVRVLEELDVERLWLTLDEWSSVPLDLQPFLADMFRRALMPLQQVTIKVAAIEHRTDLKIPLERGDYIGWELGADISADLDLDDFMVFDNDESKAKDFFGDLLFKHLVSVIEEGQFDVNPPLSRSAAIQQTFTQVTAFDELVRAAEGVPRDAINVAIIAAQRADEDLIGVPHVRTAAKAWYQRDKEAAATADPRARDLLLWIIDKVIGERRAKAFMLRQGPASEHHLVRSLYDNRVLHLIKRGVSSRDEPGVRYNVFGIDYGCYVDLVETARRPRGLLPVEDDSGGEVYVDVPAEDYRSIRRAILDIAEFERSESTG